MKLKFKLSILVSVITIIVAATISSITLNRARVLQTHIATENLKNIAGMTAVDIQRLCEHDLYAIRTIAQTMGSYGVIEEIDRRNQYDYILYGLFCANVSYVSTYTIWLPRTIDDLDSDHITRENTTGQYMSLYTRGAGMIEHKYYHNNYKQILSKLSDKDILEDPISITMGNKNINIVNLMTPILDESNTPIGIIGIEIDISTLQPFVTSIKPFETGHIAVLANNGFIMAYEDTSLIGTNIRESFEDIGEKGLNEIFRSLATAEPVLIEHNEQELVCYPFTVGNTDSPLAVLAFVPTQTVLAEVSILSRFVIILSIIAIVITAIIGFTVASRFAKPLIGVIDMLKDISQGEGDLTKRVDIISKDEIGEMLHYFNLTLDKIRYLIFVIKDKADSLFRVGNDLSNNMDATTLAMNQIGSNIKNISERAKNQSLGVHENKTTMNEITESIEKLNDHIENQSANISQSSSAVEEMIANIASVTKTLVRNFENVKQLAEDSELGHASLQDISSDIQTIARESEGLLEITVVMENIASQTNLLSMNAAIEAAHAGESGKGFAVVADEIRKLAESSSEQSKTIAVVLKKIKTSIDKIMTETDIVLNHFEAIDMSVKKVSQQEEKIRDAMEEQEKGGQEVLTAIARLNDITQNVRNGSSVMLTGSKKIIDGSLKLGKLSEEVSFGVKEISDGTKQISSAVNRVNSISVKNKEYIDTLADEISKFKI